MWSFSKVSQTKPKSATRGGRTKHLVCLCFGSRRGREVENKGQQEERNNKHRNNYCWRKRKRENKGEIGDTEREREKRVCNSAALSRMRSLSAMTVTPAS